MGIKNSDTTVANLGSSNFTKSLYGLEDPDHLNYENRNCLFND